MAEDPKPTEVKPIEGDATASPASDASAEANQSVDVAGAGVEGAEKGQARANLEFELLRRREQAKKYQQERESLRKELEDAKSQLAQLQATPPDATVSDIAPSREDVQKIVRAEVEAERLEVLKEQALNYILSQPDVKRADLEAIGQIMKDRGLDELGNKRPLEAALSALDAWRQAKGRMVDGKLKEEAKSVGGGSSMATSLPAAGKKVWTREEISNIPDAEYPKYRDEIHAAYREGRIR